MTDPEAYAKSLEAEVAAASPGPWWIGGETDDEGTKLLARQGTPFDSPHDPEVEWVATFYDTGPSGHGPNLTLAASAPQRALALARALRALHTQEVAEDHIAMCLQCSGEIGEPRQSYCDEALPLLREATRRHQEALAAIRESEGADG